MYQAIDGRIWYFPEITNFWSTKGSTSENDWYALDFGQPKEISGVKIYLFDDGKTYGIPDSLTIDYQNGNEWLPAKINFARLIVNTGNIISLNSLTTNQLRINFKHNMKQVALCEIECY